MKLRHMAQTLALLGGMIPIGSATAAAAETVGRLIVFTSEACGFCREFDRDVGRIYPKTQLSARLPMERVDRDHPSAAVEAQLVKQIHFTPTVIVLDRQGKERGRSVGYRGEEAFWIMAEEWARLLEKQPTSNAR
ncbi:MAG: hypothetical protein HQL51_10780 [Magnetococcales bacterium]|nr:hypothetical protein [Magnetococcales bacterium]